MLKVLICTLALVVPGVHGECRAGSVFDDITGKPCVKRRSATKPSIKTVENSIVIEAKDVQLKLEGGEVSMGNVVTQIDELKSNQSAMDEYINGELKDELTKNAEELGDAVNAAATALADAVSDLTTADQKTADKLAAVASTVDATEKAYKAADIALGKQVDAVTAKVGNDLQSTIEKLTKATAAAQATASDIADALHGTVAQFPAESCGAIKKKKSSATDGIYYLKKGSEVFSVFCKVVSNTLVSMGGDGKTQASAASGCGGNPLVKANPSGDKWIDPDANAEDTRNAKKINCIGGESTPAETCGQLVKLGAKKSGAYWVKYSGKAKKVWCDLTTDGGGWVLVSTQKPDGAFRRGGAQKNYVDGAGGTTSNKPVNQRYPQSYISQLAGKGTYQVMVEENSGSDRTNGLVMMYKMNKNEVLPLIGGNVNVGSRYDWHRGSGNYRGVQNNAYRSGCWFGISTHSWSWYGFETGERCTFKPDFRLTSANNADYKMDHCGSHSGTTRCVHGRTGIGIAHWIRLCSDGDYIAGTGKHYGKC